MISRLSKLKIIVITVTAAALIAAAVAVMLCRPNFLVLRLENADNGKLFSEFSADDCIFSVSFIHSVNKSRVEEVYKYKNGNIYLTDCIYYGFGAGVLTEVEPEWELSYGETGEMIVSNMNVELHDLTYIVGTVSDHILTLNGESYSLSELCGRNSRVRFEFVTRKFFRRDYSETL